MPTATSQTSTSPYGCWASSLTRPGGRCAAGSVAEGQLDREPPDDEVDDAEGDQAGDGHPVDPVASVGLREALHDAFLSLIAVVEISQRRLDGAVEGRVGVDHRPQRARREPRRARRRPGTRGSRRRPDRRRWRPTRTPRSASSTTLIRPRAPGPWVKPREDCSRGVVPTRTVSPGVARLLLGHPDAADLGIGERHVREGVVARGRRRPAPGMSRSAIADWYIETWVNAPLPVTSPMAQSPSAAPQPVVDLDRARRRVEPDRLQAEVVEVGRAPGGDQQLVGDDLLVALRASRVNAPSA